MQDDPRSAVQAWADAFNAADLQRVLALYAPDAVLWGTMATDLIDTQEGRRNYFERALAGLPAPTVQLQSLLLQPLGDLVLASGAYLLKLAGRRHPARFTFVLQRRSARWLIVNHHSSLMPAGPQGS